MAPVGDTVLSAGDEQVRQELSRSSQSNGGDREPTRKQSKTITDDEVMSSIFGKEYHQGPTHGTREELGAGGGILCRVVKEILAEEMAFELRDGSSKEVAK